MPRPGESAPRTVTLMPGDGIGPLVADAVVQVLAAMRAPVQFEVCEISGRMPRLPAELLDSLHRNGVGLKGGLATPVGGGVSSLNMRLRQELDLFANLVFCHDIPIATKRPHHHHRSPAPSSHTHTHSDAHDISAAGAESDYGDAGAGVGLGEQGQGHARRDVVEALRRRPRGVNIVVVRENTEGEYSGLEHEVVPAGEQALFGAHSAARYAFHLNLSRLISCRPKPSPQVVSKFCSERIARYAFQYAYLNGRRAVTAVHKANVMKVSDGLFLDSCRQTYSHLRCIVVAQSRPHLRYSEIIVAQAYPRLRYSEIIVSWTTDCDTTQESSRSTPFPSASSSACCAVVRQVAQAYPHLRYSEIIVDNCCMQLVRRPQQFDVMVTPNLYGSLVANTAAGICGGSYLMPGGNVGDNAAVFEQGASAGNVGNERMVSERTANPTALLLSAAMMLHHLHLPVFADRVEGAVKGVLAEGAVLTLDMGGRATTQDMVDAIVDRLG
ncbi:unnamed protein product [Closterium sp. NIES-64]|nr:unnamed protein product [Closterium sp. NIES-64]